AVDDGFNGVIFAAVKGERVGEILDLAVYAGPKPLTVKIIQRLLKLTLAAADDGRHNRDALARAQFQNALDDLLGGLARDGLAAVGAVGRADGGVKQAQVVVDFGDGSHG